MENICEKCGRTGGKHFAVCDENYSVGICLRLNRYKDVLFDGELVYINKFMCKSCKNVYMHNDIYHSYCPSCSIKYEKLIDASF